MRNALTTGRVFSTSETSTYDRGGPHRIDGVPDVGCRRVSLRKRVGVKNAGDGLAVGVGALFGRRLFKRVHRVAPLFVLGNVTYPDELGRLIIPAAQKHPAALQGILLQCVQDHLADYLSIDLEMHGRIPAIGIRVTDAANLPPPRLRSLPIIGVPPGEPSRCNVSYCDCLATAAPGVRCVGG